MRRLAILTAILIAFFMSGSTSERHVVAETTAIAVGHEMQETTTQPPEEETVEATTQPPEEEMVETTSQLPEQLEERTHPSIPTIEYFEKIVEEVIILGYMAESLSEWAMTHDNTEPISLWKKTDEDGNLVIALKNEKGQFIVSYKFEEIQSNYDEWVLCAEGITSQDVCDCAFIAYHEVGGNNPKNVQAQVCVLLNRQKFEKEFADTIRGVVTEEAQYSTAENVLDRWLKSSCDLEKEDLEKCFQQTILVFAGELIQVVPENVVFAAQGSQGNGVWQEIDGTKYCFLNY